ncbi:MAG: hypothetical protein WED83_02810 [Acidimicrobiia bacterium]
MSLAVIPEPEPNTRSVLIRSGEGTVVMQGEGKVILECGNCHEPLVQGIEMKQLKNLVFKCNNCGVYNETLA